MPTQLAPGWKQVTSGKCVVRADAAYWRCPKHLLRAPSGGKPPLPPPPQSPSVPSVGGVIFQGRRGAAAQMIFFSSGAAGTCEARPHHKIAYLCGGMADRVATFFLAADSPTRTIFSNKTGACPDFAMRVPTLRRLCT